MSDHWSNGNYTQVLRRVFPSERTAGVSSRSIAVTNKTNSLTYTVASSFVSTSPSTVTTVVGFFDILTVSNAALLRSFLLTMCMLAPESATNSLFSGLLVDAAASIHSQEGAFPGNRCRFWGLSVLWYATQLSHSFHNSYCTFVTTVLRPFVGLSFNLVVREQTLVPCFASRFSFIELTFGRMPIVTK